MRRPILTLAVAPLLLPLALMACGRGNPQADRLDNAANQADPAAAAVMRNEADAIRANGAEGETSTANSSVQSAMANAGEAAAAGNAAQPTTSPLGAKPHQPGDPVPPPQTRR